MKLVFGLTICLAFTVHKIRAEPFIFEAISGGALLAGSLAEVGFQAADDVAHAVLDVTGEMTAAGVDFVLNLGKGAESLSNLIAESDIKSKTLARALQKAHIILQRIQDASRDVSQAYADAGEKIQQSIAALKNNQQAKVDALSGEIRKNLSKSSKEAQEKGQSLLRYFSIESSEDLNKCTNEILDQFKELQANTNAVAKQFKEPLNTLSAEVEKCATLSTTNRWGLVRCALKTRKALKPLALALFKLSSEKAHIVRAGQQHLLRSACVATASAKFRTEGDSVGWKIDQLVAEDKKKSVLESQPIDETNPADEMETAPAKTAPAETSLEKYDPSEIAPAKTALAESAQPKTAPTETDSVKIAPAEPAPAKAAPAETAPTETAPAEKAPAKTALAESSAAKTDPSKTAPAETSPARMAPAENYPANA